MLYLNFHYILENRGIQNPLRFLVTSGFNYHTANMLLHDSKNSVRFQDLEKLCLLLECTVDDLLAWNPSTTISKPENRPLSKLMNRKRRGLITAKLRQLSNQQLEEVRGFLDRMEVKEE